MKSFYNLDAAEYKKLKKEFKATYVGGKLAFILEVLVVFLVIDILTTVLEVIFGGYSDILNINYLFEVMLIDVILIVGAIICHSTYLNNLKQYYDESNKKK